MQGSRIVRIGSLLAVLLVAGCVGHGDPPPPPVPSVQVERPPTLDTAFLGCLNIAMAECTDVGRTAVNRTHMDRPGGTVVVVEVELGGCMDAVGDEIPSCPPSITHRTGRVTVEFDGFEPLWYQVSGDPKAPTLELVTGVCPPLCFELSKPASDVVSGSGPFPYRLSHCGINHFVDFDGSWWVLVGAAVGEPMGMQLGEIRLLGRDLAEYRQEGSGFGQGRVVATLARFPGMKYIWQACI